MKLTQHPEYQTRYLHHQVLAQDCLSAVVVWQASNKPLAMNEVGLQWTPATARTFVAAVGGLFAAYNALLWQEFHYCRQCGGQCCVVDASDVRPFDLIACALLELTPPLLPDRIAANVHDCIYLAGSQCTWPADWRTLKCWSFYCLGSGPWPLTATLGELHAAVMSRLQLVVNTHLPEPLRRYEQVAGLNFADHLADPVAFANILHSACHDLLVAPLHAAFPLFPIAPPTSSQAKRRSTPIFLMADPDLHEFITAATVTLYESPPFPPAGVAASVDQFLADLETLTWIIENRPAQRQHQLQELYRRYAAASAPAKGAAPSLWYQMRNQLLLLLNEQAS